MRTLGKYINLILILLFFGVFSVWYGFREVKEGELRKTIVTIDNLQSERKFDESFKYFTERLIRENPTADDTKLLMTNWKKPLSWKTEVESVVINGDEAITHSSISYCFSEPCAKTNFNTLKQTNIFKYISGKWYMDDGVLCTRETGYEMPPEFERAVSLILQRFFESQFVPTKQMGRNFSLIKNCLDIQYGDAKEMENASGAFSYSRESTNDRLKIFVSPTFKSGDDILTAALLTHELTHALNHSLGQDLFMPCFENEAQAYFYGYTFLNILNEGETKIINARIKTDDWKQVQKDFDVFDIVSKVPGENPYIKFLNYVKNDPTYIKQCASQD